MTKTITIKIHAEVPDGVDPKFTAYQVLQQMTIRSDRLDSWQEINAPIGDETIGECHFEVVDDEDPEFTPELRNYAVTLERIDYFTVLIKATNRSEAGEMAREQLCNDESPQPDSCDGFEINSIEEIE